MVRLVFSEAHAGSGLEKECSAEPRGRKQRLKQCLLGEWGSLGGQ